MTIGFWPTYKRKKCITSADVQTTMSITKAIAKKTQTDGKLHNQLLDYTNTNSAATIIPYSCKKISLLYPPPLILSVIFASSSLCLGNYTDGVAFRMTKNNPLLLQKLLPI